MGRPASGQILTSADSERGTSYSVRFRGEGYPKAVILLGSSHDGWTRERAEDESRIVAEYTDHKQRENAEPEAIGRPSLTRTRRPYRQLKLVPIRPDFARRRGVRGAWAHGGAPQLVSEPTRVARTER